MYKVLGRIFLTGSFLDPEQFFQVMCQLGLTLLLVEDIHSLVPRLSRGPNSPMSRDLVFSQEQTSHSVFVSPCLNVYVLKFMCLYVKYAGAPLPFCPVSPVCIQEQTSQAEPNFSLICFPVYQDIFIGKFCLPIGVNLLICMSLPENFGTES